MTEQELKELYALIENKISETKEEIRELRELTKPVSPDNAYGRLSRMDAINNKTINEAALREKKQILQKFGTS